MDTKNKNKTRLIKVGAVVAGALVATSTAIFAIPTTMDTSTSNTFEKFKSKMMPLHNLTIEERVDFFSDNIEFKINHLEEITTILNDKGIDTTDIETIINDFENMQQFLDEVDLDTVSKEELKDAFFELRPEKGSRDLVRDIIRENLTSEEIEELKEGFRANREELKEKYNLPDRKYMKNMKGMKNMKENFNE